MIPQNVRAACVVLLCLAVGYCSAQTVHLPSSKEIIGPVPGSPQPLNSLPMAAAWSPDHRYLALVNAGFGTVESNYEQSIAILDTATGKLTDYPEPRTEVLAPQTYYSGIAFSRGRLASVRQLRFDQRAGRRQRRPDGQCDRGL